MNRRFSRFLIAVLLPATVIMVGGCSRDTDEGVDLAGAATWKGQPLASGIVTLSADVTKGNSGHQGWAPIENGRFDTRHSGGKVAPLGACIAQVNCKQPSTDPSHPRGTHWILRYEYPLEISRDTTEVNIDVPP